MCVTCIQNCRICGDCGSRTPGSGPSSRWHLNYSVCDSCYQQRNKGLCCPVCCKAYRHFTQSKMLPCSQCKRCVTYAAVWLCVWLGCRDRDEQVVDTVCLRLSSFMPSSVISMQHCPHSSIPSVSLSNHPASGSYFSSAFNGIALNCLHCAQVPLRNCSLTHPTQLSMKHEHVMTQKLCY